jgi:integrase
MTGSIQAKKGRTNYFAVLNTRDSSGKRKQKWIDTGFAVKGNNRRKAEARLNELLVEYGDAGIDFSKDTGFTDFMEQWLESRRVSLAASTYDAYRMTLDVHILPYFKPKNLRVADIKPVVVQEYVSDKLKSMKANTVRKHLANISSCMDSAVKQNIIAFNPVGRIELPKMVKFTEAKPYNEREIEQLLECAKGDPLEIVIWLALFYGLRRSEVLGLMWGALDFEEKTIAIQHTVVKVGRVTHRENRTKNESSCTVFPIPEMLIARLKKWKGQQQEWRKLQPNDYFESDYICTYADGRPLTPDFASRHFGLLLRKNRMPHIRFHDLRHSAACYLKYLGFDLKDIQTWLRHKDIQTTMNIYVSLDMEAKSNIANRLDSKLKSLTAHG